MAEPTEPESRDTDDTDSARSVAGAERRARHAADLALVRASLDRSDATAAGRLAERLECVPRILAALNRRGGGMLSHEDLRDLSQDTVIRIWNKRGEFQGLSTVETWSYRFCFLEYLNRVRSHRRQRSREGRLAEGEDFGVDAPDLARLLDLEQLDATLDELGPPASEVVRLKHFEHLTFTEIGGALDLSPNTAKTHYYRGIDWLRRHYRQPPRSAGDSESRGQEARPR